MISAALCLLALTLPAAPRPFETPEPSPPGRRLDVARGGDLQAALDRAQPGDVVALEPGATFSGNFTLPPKPGAAWIVLRTGTDRLPPAGRRLRPAQAALLAKLVSPNSEPALRAAPGAHHYRIVGLEFALADGVDRNYGLIELGDFAQNAPEQIPHHLVLDRVYVHGTPRAQLRRGIALNGAWTAVIDSHVSDVHEAGADAQAVCGSTGPGPFKIVNNYLEASGENVMFGGADPRIRDLVPADIELRHNHLTKPLGWKGGAWTVKNLLELKNARRVLIEGNLLEYNWPAAQNGFAILFTTRNQDGGAPWSVVEDVSFENNVVRHVASGINILGHDDGQPSGQTRRILIRNNLFEDVGGPWGGKGCLLQLLDGSADVVVERNTAAQTGTIVAVSGRPHTGFVFRDNVAPHNEYGIGGDNHFGDPLGTIQAYLPEAVITGNVIAGGAAARYPPGNAFRDGDGARAGVDRAALRAALAAGDSS
ncbi:MAG TPA: hypothetical protein VJS92_16160 [Candidatus Polarisedimenticolaceae bacterium]|nr:hypothetical protein [Candidatus Polarisedimenticolaceae bacterium]